MDDFGMLARDFGFRPQGKPAPMASSKANTGIESDGGDRRARSSSSSSFLDDPNSDGLLFSDVFGGPPKYTTTNTKSSSPLSDFDYDSVFKSSSAANDSKNKSSSSVPVYDKPVYDDDIDIFDGLPGLKSKSTSSSIRYDDDMFSSISSAPKQRDQFDDLLGNFGRTEQAELKSNKNSRGLDDLIPGFGVSSPTGSDRPISESSQPQKPTVSANHSTSNVMENPFVDFESTSSPLVSPPGVFTDPLEEISKPSNSGNTKVDGSSVSGGIFDDLDPLNGFGKSVPAYSFEMNKKDESPSRTRSSMNSKESVGKSSFKNSESHSQKKTPATNFHESPQGLFDMPAASPDSNESVSQTAASPFVNFNSNETNSQVDMSPRSEEHVEPTDDVWVTVSDIPLFTQPTSAPPPSRPPPPRPARASNARKKGNEFSSPSSSQYSQSPSLVRPAAKSSVVSQIDEFEEFVMGRTQNVDEYADVHSGDEMNTNSAAAASAAAMKDAMERAEAKFRHAKEVREREYVKAARTKEAVQLEKDEQAMQDAQERDFRENQERLEFEQRQREEEEREQRRLEKERERLREIEREREKARQAVERATREARERASVEARERAAAEARLKVERAAVQRAQAEARERAAVGAKERAEKTAAEARGRASAEATEKEAREKAAVARAEAEARRRAERAAVERATAEARERAAAEARERAAAAAAARTNQQKNDDDLESFFSMGSRPSSAPRPRANSSDPVDPQFQNRGGPDGSRRTSSVSVSSNIRKASSTTNIVDDLTSIFGAAPSYGEFQESEGENEERRRARLERHQRTQERAAKALAEKNQRDLQTQRDQEERHRISETLDSEIKRWAAGKEGNLRALLSTLQYVLWPECGWQPVSLTDLITGPSVKKAYRKATLCIHPDKVQQKGANIQQKYIAEKVFDLLKEAWNKFNSEELF